MESNSTAFLIKIKLRHSLGRPSRSDFVQSEFVTLFGGELVMIKLKMSIEDISEYQTGILPKNAVKIETPQSIEEMMKKAAPIAAVLCVLMFVTMLCKTVMNKTVVISHVFILIGV